MLLALAYCWVTVAAATRPRTSMVASVCSNGISSYLPETGERNSNDPSPTCDGSQLSSWANIVPVQIANTAKSTTTIRTQMKFLNRGTWAMIPPDAKQECKNRASSLGGKQCRRFNHLAAAMKRSGGSDVFRR